jgi:uridine kinase
MAQWKPEKTDVLDALAAEILHNYGRGRVIVAVDGVDGAGKSTFAGFLIEAFHRAGHTALVASVDDFHRPRDQRYARGKDSPEGFYLDSYDYPAFRELLVQPFKRGATEIVAGTFDHVGDVPTRIVETVEFPDAILVIEGIFLQRPELAPLWNYAVWLDVPRAVRDARLIERDGPTSVGPRYSGGQDLYLSDANPRAAANAIIDNSDADHPRRVFADSC